MAETTIDPTRSSSETGGEQPDVSEEYQKAEARREGDEIEGYVRELQHKGAGPGTLSQNRTGEQQRK